jgi:hypothetical protein
MTNTSTTKEPDRPAKRLRWRVPLIIAASCILMVGCDDVLGPGLVEGSFDQARYALLTSQLRVGEPRADVIRAFQLTDTPMSTPYEPKPEPMPPIGAQFIPWHMICFAAEWNLTVHFDRSGRVTGWDRKDVGDGC